MASPDKPTYGEMSRMKPILITALLIMLIQTESCGQDRIKGKETAKVTVHIGGRCEGCEAIYESPTAFEKLNQIDTLPDFGEQGPKIRISGVVYESDGKVPAKDVVIYVYHTD